MSKDPKSPATTSEAFDVMSPSWYKIQTVLDGTKALRAAGQQFLPQHFKESNESYSERLAKCTLFNMTKLTLDSWVGRPFSDPVTVDKCSYVELLKDIDTLGNNITVFARNVFKEGLAKAFTHVLVEMPRLEPRVDGKPRTLQDDKDVRPYWVHIHPESLFFAESRTIAGVEKLIEIRFYEEITERNGFAEVTSLQIKRIHMQEDVPLVTTYRKVKRKWEVSGTPYAMDIDEIPLVTFYADRQGFLFGLSPIEDLADLNIAHWQSTSDQRACLTTARFPILAVSGGTDADKTLVVGPNRFITLGDPHAKVYYVEHTGAAIKSGLEDLLELTRQMGEYGAEFLKKRPNRETATARAMDSDESTSPLQDVTLRFIEFMDRALSLTSKWLNLDPVCEVKITTDFTPAPVGGEGLRTLLETRKNGDLSREAFLNELKRSSLLDPHFDKDMNELELEEEVMVPGKGPVVNNDLK